LKQKLGAYPVLFSRETVGVITRTTTGLYFLREMIATRCFTLQLKTVWRFQILLENFGRGCLGSPWLRGWALPVT